MLAVTFYDVVKWIHIMAVVVAFGGVFFGPKETRLAELATEGGGAEYERILVQVRNVTYVAIALVLIAAYMMVTKVGS